MWQTQLKIDHQAGIKIYIYIGNTRGEEDFLCEYMIKFNKHFLLNNYARGYTFKYRDVIGESPPKRNMVCGYRFNIRYLNFRFPNDLIERVRIDMSKRPKEKKYKRKRNEMILN